MMVADLISLEPLQTLFTNEIGNDALILLPIQNQEVSTLLIQLHDQAAFRSQACSVRLD